MIDCFSALGVKRRFALDSADLERRYYQISREIHPDRFTTGGADAQRLSLEKMSDLNQAYRTLKDPVSRRSHLLELEGLVVSQGSQIPMELAEGWFELQDALMEDPGAAQAKLAQFEAEFAALKQTRERQIAELERQADLEAERVHLDAYRAILAQIAEVIRQESYLSSMERDIERIKAQRAH